MAQYSGIWTRSQQMQALGASTWPKVPGAPTIGTATVSSTTASVAFTAPTCAGIPANITGYLATSTPGCFTGTGSSSPISVAGLTIGTSYTFKVKATNAVGYGPCSAASNAVVPAAIGQQAYTTAGTYTWVAPAGVTSVSVVVIGGGAGGGGGGGLTYKNNQAVTPGSSYTVIVGAGGSDGDGGTSRFNTTILATGGGKVRSQYYPPCGAFRNFAYGGGGSGGTASFSGGGVPVNAGCASGGGGAAGYTANGGCGVNVYSYCCCGTSILVPGNGGSAGDAGNSGGYGGAGLYCWPARAGAGGGGQGIYGLGLGASYRGTNGGNGAQYSPGAGGLYGGGGGQGGGGACAGGGRGAVRIIWPGTTRAFPSTNTGDL